MFYILHISQIIYLYISFWWMTMTMTTISTSMTISTFIYGYKERISIIFASCDGHTYGRTDKAVYRVADSRLKMDGWINKRTTQNIDLLICHFKQPFWPPEHHKKTEKGHGYCRKLAKNCCAGKCKPHPFLRPAWTYRKNPRTLKRRSAKSSPVSASALFTYRPDQNSV